MRICVCLLYYYCNTVRDFLQSPVCVKNTSGGSLSSLSTCATSEERIAFYGCKVGLNPWARRAHVTAISFSVKQLPFKSYTAINPLFDLGTIVPSALVSSWFQRKADAYMTQAKVAAATGFSRASSAITCSRLALRRISRGTRMVAVNAPEASAESNP